MADASAPRLAVLLVEDDPVQLMEAAAALRDAGYEVAEASTVEVAQAHLAARPEPVAMVADVDLVGAPLSGFTLAKAVAARWPELAILIVSGVEWPREQKMPMGARFLRKPFTADGLAEALRAVLGARGIGQSVRTAMSENDVARANVPATRDAIRTMEEASGAHSGVQRRSFLRNAHGHALLHAADC
jgi:DNA-binding NtrC family response regulator